ncbi:MAG: MerR family transcriptional regulator [Dehalococcoidales bacterium]|nr:MerR family transcriptional regulator [Dehalococcoidales bacterium]
MIYRIGDFSRLSRVTTRALRYYDEIGLLKPVRVDQVTGYRFYSVDQLPKLNYIVTLKNIGFSLDDINELMNNGMPPDYIKRLLQVKKTEIQDRIDQDRDKLRQVDIWLDRVGSAGITPTEIFVQRKTVPPVRVISRREIGTYDETVTRLTSDILQQINRPENVDSVKISGPVTGLFYDDEYKEIDADIEVAVPVEGEFTIQEPGFEIKILPECTVISAVHKGYEQNIGKTYAQIIEYAEVQVLKLVTPIRELYLEYGDTIPEEDYLTEIQFPFRE